MHDIRAEDRIARVGERVSVLTASVTSSGTTLQVADSSVFTVGSRYLLGDEVVLVSALPSGTTATVTRGVWSVKVAHDDTTAINAIDGMHIVVSETRHAGWLRPVTANQTFVVLPRELKITDNELAETTVAAWRVRGSYQESGGDRTTVERDGLTIYGRLGLIIAERDAGGHWELGVTDA